jgi:hypothetical protein
MPSSSIHAIAIIPAELLAARFARFANTISLPRLLDWVGFRICLFETCSAFIHITACMFAEPL